MLLMIGLLGYMQDVNEHAPMFSRQTYSATVYANSTPGLLAARKYTVKSSDENDSSSNHRLLI